MSSNKIYYKRNLPHIQNIGATFFVTCSLKVAIPKSRLQEIKEIYVHEKKKSDQAFTLKEMNYQKYFARKKYVLAIDNLLHKQVGPSYLNDSKLAQILLDRIKSYDMKYYRLLALSIMPNHFHMLIDTSIQLNDNLVPNSIPKNYVQLHKIMHLIKGASSRYINQLRNATGEQVWENESFDIYIRNEKMLNRVINYILNNPVKAGLVKSYEDHSFTFVNAI